MSLLVWDNGYSVNVQEIDKQHKVLIDIINKLHDAMKVGKGKEVVGETLNELVTYTVFHFGHEEKLFSGNGYADANSHKAEHRKLIEQVQTLQNDFNNGKTLITMEIMHFLKDWLANHIMVTDKKYSNYLNSKGIF